MSVIRLRVAGLIIRDGLVLLARHVKGGRSTYLFPGGGVEPGETAHEALMRELREEAGTACSVETLRYVVEARAPDASRHIVQLLFEVRLEGDVGASKDERVAGCEWCPIDALRTLPLHPAVGPIIADDLQRGNTICRYLLAPWIVT
jgi:8-oxo-dGTP pyrophosphatase MutT (NUDIX family)